MPNAKRYAESDQEKSEILPRHNTLLSSLLGEGQGYVLITTGYSDSPEPVRSYPQLEMLVGSSMRMNERMGTGLDQASPADFAEGEDLSPKLSGMLAEGFTDLHGAVVVAAMGESGERVTPDNFLT